MRVLPLLALALACAPVLPQEPVRRALVRDLARVVEVRAETGWFVDQSELSAVLTDAMHSVCRVPESERAAALAWLDAEIARLGGPVDVAYKNNGRDLDAVADLLLLTRTLLLLAEADRVARSGQCPFWIEPDPEFAGRQGFRERFFGVLETGGRFITGLEGSTLGIGGGAAGRLLAGYGFSDDFSLLAGAEIAGGARFANIQLGTRLEVPAVIVILVAPLVARMHGLSSYLDFEAGPLFYVNQASGRISPGFRLGIAGGGSYLRLVRGILPGAAFAVTSENSFGVGDEPNVHLVTFGLRATFSLSR